MTRKTLLCVAGIVCAVMALYEPAHGAGELLISCEGTESGGGGSRIYQYSLKNTGASPVTLTLFYLGTEDLNPR